MLRKTATALLVLVCTAVTGFAQNGPLLDQIISKTLKGENCYNDIVACTQNCTSLQDIWEIESRLGADEADVRYLLFGILNKVARLKPNEAVTSRAIYLLIDKGLTDNAQRISGRCIEWLYEFNANDIDPQCRNRLGAIVVTAKANTSELIRLAGKLKLTSVVPVLEQRLATSKNTKELWAIRCSLARMGNPDQQSYCLEKVKNMGINDQTIQYLLPDLIFIQSKAAIDYLLACILEDKLDCSSFDPDKSEKTNCAYRLMELVAPCIVDFPVGLRASGDLNVEDYAQALAQVRQWIPANKDTYVPRFE